MSPAQTNEKSRSTGPRSPEGKRRSALNALRHGLTGRVVVLPSEDMDAYQAFCQELMADLAPRTPVERQYAQTFCDTQWRLNRIRSIEDSMFSLGHFEPASDIDPGHPQIHAALTAARVFRADSKAFLNLSLYEQRLQRTLKESLRQLQELQAKRIAAEAAVAQEAAAEKAAEEKEDPEDTPIPATNSTPADFVFSTGEIPEIDAQARGLNDQPTIDPNAIAA